MIVLDASAMLELLRRSAVGQDVAARIADEESVHIPHLLDVEVAQALRRLVAAGSLAPQRAEQAIVDLASIAVERHQHEDLLLRVWQLRGNLTAYDAVYVALAEALDAPLLTLDAGLAGAPGNGAEVVLF